MEKIKNSFGILLIMSMVFLVGCRDAEEEVDSGVTTSSTTATISGSISSSDESSSLINRSVSGNDGVDGMRYVSAVPTSGSSEPVTVLIGSNGEFTLSVSKTVNYIFKLLDEYGLPQKELGFGSTDDSVASIQSNITLEIELSDSEKIVIESSSVVAQTKKEAEEVGDLEPKIVNDGILAALVTILEDEGLGEYDEDEGEIILIIAKEESNGGAVQQRMVLKIDSSDNSDSEDSDFGELDFGTQAEIIVTVVNEEGTILSENDRDSAQKLTITDGNAFAAVDVAVEMAEEMIDAIADDLDIENLDFENLDSEFDSTLDTLVDELEDEFEEFEDQLTNEVIEREIAELEEEEKADEESSSATSVTWNMLPEDFNQNLESIGDFYDALEDAIDKSNSTAMDHLLQAMLDTEDVEDGIRKYLMDNLPDITFTSEDGMYDFMEEAYDSTEEIYGLVSEDVLEVLSLIADGLENAYEANETVTLRTELTDGYNVIVTPEHFKVISGSWKIMISQLYALAAYQFDDDEDFEAMQEFFEGFDDLYRDSNIESISEFLKTELTDFTTLDVDNDLQDQALEYAQEGAKELFQGLYNLPTYDEGTPELDRENMLAVLAEDKFDALDGISKFSDAVNGGLEVEIDGEIVVVDFGALYTFDIKEFIFEITEGVEGSKTDEDLVDDYDLATMLLNLYDSTLEEIFPDGLPRGAKEELIPTGVDWGSISIDILDVTEEEEYDDEDVIFEIEVKDRNGTTWLIEQSIDGEMRFKIEKV